MTRIRLGSEEIKYITIFESITGANVKDCVQTEGTMGFLVDEGYMGLAIGRSGKTIDLVRKKIGKNVMVMEFSDDTAKFVKNLFQPVKVRQVIIHDKGNDRVAMIEVSKKDRMKALGHNGRRIKIAKEMINRHCGLSDIIIKTV